jgi:hypothetical protein
MHMLRILTLLISGIAFSAYGQNYSSSPFSSVGIGTFGNMSDGQFAGLGNITAPVVDSNVSNPSNPSSYAFLSKGQPLFGFGIASRISTYSRNGLSKTDGTAGISQISLLFPIAKRLGAGVGLMPYSSKGYGFYERSYAYDDSVTHQYVGSGTTQRVFVGLGYELLSLKRHSISLGGNFAYIFGSVSDERRAILDDISPKGGLDISSYRLNALYYDFGLTYQVKLNEKGNQHLTLSGTYVPQLKLSTNLDYGLYYATDVSDNDTYDTLQFVENNKGTITAPSTMTVGFAYSYSPDNSNGNLKRVYQLKVYGEYASTNWKNYEERFSNVTSTQSFENSSKIALGVQFVPSSEATSKSAGTNYLHRIRYRIGGYNLSTPYLLNDKQVKEKAVTLGFGLPMSSVRSNSTLNVSFQMGTQGNGDKSDVKENFYSISIGVVLAPSFNDRWFRRYKLD